MNSIHQQYEATLAFLYQQLPMYQRVGSTAFKKDLTNIIALCAHLKQPQEQFPSIHIAGTNGKGSTAHILAAMLQAGDRRVGMYTSPHYKDFRERIKINGQLVSKQFIVDFVEQYRTAFEEIQPSFFEITVAMAFKYFAQQKVDIAIIETGLGGRLDSTNIITPMLSIITNIGYDHQQFLGETLPEIAAEKAGIIKPYVPVLIGEEHRESMPVFEKKATQEKAPLYETDILVTIEEKEVDADYTIYSAMVGGFDFEELYVNLHGSYQINNLRTALAAVDILNYRDLEPRVEAWDIVNGLADIKKLTYFIGRWQTLSTNPTILCDSAHNKDGLKTVMKQVQKLNYKHLHIVFGMVNDKDPKQILSLLPSSALYYFAKADIPRGLDADILQQKAASCGLEGKSYNSVINALAAAKRAAGMEDLIYVGGSIFVVAEVL